MEFVIDEMKSGDWKQVLQIYKEGIETGDATFEKDIPTFDSWISNHISGCSIVARKNDKILGWAALSPTSNRKVYSGVNEVSIYVSEECRGKGIGITLFKKLIDLSEDKGTWTLQAGIFPENKVSIDLHKKCGFRIVGIREKIGEMNGVWRDVVLMERRSKKVGI